MATTPYDNGAKRLLSLCMQDFLDWFSTGAQATGNRSKEFESIKIYADEIHETMWCDQPILYHLEIQSGPDPDMAQRLLEYNTSAYRYYQCVLKSYVIYLRKGGERPSSPLMRIAADGEEIVRFNYKDIEMCNYTPQEIFAKGLRGLFPLIPFCVDGARKEVIEDIIQRLLPADDRISKELLALTQLFASLAFKKNDEANQAWLRRRFNMLQDIFQDTPAYQHILEMGRQEGIVEERKKSVQTLRSDLLTIVRRRFPKLGSFARKAIARIESPSILHSLLVNIALAQTEEEARNYLVMGKQANE